jgi:hypothetical protein
VPGCLNCFVAYRRQLADAEIAEAMGGGGGGGKAHGGLAVADSRQHGGVIGNCAVLRRGGTARIESGNARPDRTHEAAWRGRMLRSGSYGISPAVKPTFVGVRDEGVSHIDRLFMSVNRLHLSRDLEFEAQSIVGGQF